MNKKFIIHSLIWLLISCYICLDFCYSATLEENIQKMIYETLKYNEDTLKELTEKQRNQIKEEKPVIQLIKVEGEKSNEERENFSKTVVIINETAESLFNVLIDLNNYSKNFESVKISKVLETKDEEGKKEEKEKKAIIYYQQVGLPIVPAINSYMKITHYKKDSNNDGNPEQYVLWWRQEKEYSGKIKDKNGKPIENNLIYNFGSWNIIPLEEKKSLIFYNIISEPEFYVPAIVWAKANTWVGIPNVLKELKKASLKEEYKKGNYK